MSHTPISLEIAKACIERCKAQEANNGKGAKRDKSALEFIIDASLAMKVFGARADTGTACISANETAKSLEMLSYMVSIRGYSFVVEFVTKAAT